MNSTQTQTTSAIQSVLEIIRAVEGVCAWPNLTLLPDGTILAVIWNQPCHGKWEGDLDCWASTDGGRRWIKRSQVSQHEPGTNRMNCAVGLAANGDILVLVSGWSERGVAGKPRNFDIAHVLCTWVYRSSDGGHNWCKTGTLPDSQQQSAYIPFGDIHTAQDGALCVAAYTCGGVSASDGKREVFMFRSYDDGLSWGHQTLLHPDYGNETAILPLGKGHWIAATRTHGMHLNLVTSSDDGHSWKIKEVLTQRFQAPAHLMRLQDGRILLAHGNRTKGQCGVEVKFSADEGYTWSHPLRLVDLPARDSGYPSSVQREDGTIVTAFYSAYPERGEYQYEMGITLWKP